MKQREWFRPLAPAVLEEEARGWFDLPPGDALGLSPYMSQTANLLPERRPLVPAVSHVDGSARLQTVSARDDLLFHALLVAFFALAGVPMVLNTSFNGKGEPIVETPADALRCFIGARGSIDRLFLGPFEVTYRSYAAASRRPGALLYAERVYLSQVTSAPDAADGEPRAVQVRVQTGEEGGGADGWLELPSLLHLEALQLLQQAQGADGEEGLAPDELKRYLRLVNASEDDEVGEESAAAESEPVDEAWSELEDALRWLYENRLVHFGLPPVADADTALTT